MGMLPSTLNVRRITQDKRSVQLPPAVEQIHSRCGDQLARSSLWTRDV